MVCQSEQQFLEWRGTGRPRLQGTRQRPDDLPEGRWILRPPSQHEEFELFNPWGINPWGINNGTTWATQWLSWNQIQQSFASWDDVT
jgi:hypothetical protein